ncbi:MAG: hypothetical protein U5O69_01715 [Candidatus Competibacteraceae bacterium]|nr:hypothetical protein [Candidatus Competibacteraceae bacterium]
MAESDWNRWPNPRWNGWPNGLEYAWGAVDGIKDPGQCKITFPNLDREAWDFEIPAWCAQPLIQEENPTCRNFTSPKSTTAFPASRWSGL